MMRLAMIAVTCALLTRPAGAEVSPGSVGKGNSADAVSVEGPLLRDPEAITTIHNLLRAAQAGTDPVIRGELLQQRLGLSDAHGGLERWTRVLARRLRDFDGDQGPLSAAMDRAYLLAREPGFEITLALDHLVSPKAQGEIRQWADKAFDQGRFRRFLALEAQILDTGSNLAEGNVARHQRLAVARDMVLKRPLGPVPAPGSVTPLAGLSEPLRQAAGLTVNWQVADGDLRARDPFGRSLWQRPLATNAICVTGAGGALVLDHTGLHIIAENGHTIRHAAPEGLTLLGWSDGIPWLRTAKGAHGVDGPTRRIHFAESVLAAPLTWGPQRWLWLSPTHLKISDDAGKVVSQLRHRLPAKEGWWLSRERKGSAIITAMDGRRWRIDPLDPSNPQHLLDAGRYTEVLAMADVSSEVKAAAVVALGPDSGLSQDDAMAMAPNPRWALRIAARYGRKDLASLGALASDTWIPRSSEDPLGRLDRWAWAISGLGLAQEDHTGNDQWTLKEVPDVGRAWGNDMRAVSVRAHLGQTIVEGWTPGGQPLWRQAWDVPAYLPGRSVRIRNGLAVVSEGQSRLALIDPRNGALVAYHLVGNGRALPSQTTPRGDGSLAILYPLAINSHCDVLLANGESRTLKLPAFAQSVEATAQGFRIALTNGETIDVSVGP